MIKCSIFLAEARKISGHSFRRLKPMAIDAQFFNISHIRRLKQTAIDAQFFNISHIRRLKLTANDPGSLITVHRSPINK